MKDKCTCEFYTLKLRETDDGVVFQMNLVQRMRHLCFSLSHRFYWYSAFHRWSDWGADGGVVLWSV